MHGKSPGDLSPSNSLNRRISCGLGPQNETVSMPTKYGTGPGTDMFDSDNLLHRLSSSMEHLNKPVYCTCESNEEG
jgi:hypothetical protein